MKSFIRLNFYFTLLLSILQIVLKERYCWSRPKFKCFICLFIFASSCLHSLFLQNHLTIHIHCNREFFLMFGTKNCLPKMPCFNQIKLNLITHLQNSFFLRIHLSFKQLHYLANTIT